MFPLGRLKKPLSAIHSSGRSTWVNHLCHLQLCGWLVPTPRLKGESDGECFRSLCAIELPAIRFVVRRLGGTGDVSGHCHG
jgi:hypothetical protein